MSEKEYYESDLVNSNNIIFSDNEESDSEDEVNTEMLEIVNMHKAQDILFDMKANIEIWCEDNYVDILNLNLVDIVDMNNKLFK